MIDEFVEKGAKSVVVLDKEGNIVETTGSKRLESLSQQLERIFSLFDYIAKKSSDLAQVGRIVIGSSVIVFGKYMGNFVIVEVDTSKADDIENLILSA